MVHSVFGTSTQTVSDTGSQFLTTLKLQIWSVLES